MDNPVFDAMLKTALEEALRQDAEETPAVPAPSRRQRARMRKLLADPEGYVRRLEGTEGKARNPARWLAVVVVAALLTGAAAAGFALEGGAWFQRMFEKSDWAGNYGAAADTEQLLGMAAAIDTPVVEDNGLRFELLDAVYDGQRLLVYSRLTLLTQELLEQAGEEFPIYAFDEVETLPESNGGGVGFSMKSTPWTEDEALEAGQYSFLFTLTQDGLDEGGQVSVRFKNLYLQMEEGQEETLWPGEWTLTVTLPPVEALYLEPDRACRGEDGVEWILDSLTISPLVLRMSFHCLAGQREFEWLPYEDLAVHMKNGEVVGLKDCSLSAGYGRYWVNVGLEFAMPLDLEQVEYIRVCGEDIYLEE